MSFGNNKYLYGITLSYRFPRLSIRDEYGDNPNDVALQISARAKARKRKLEPDLTQDILFNIDEIAVSDVWSNIYILIYYNPKYNTRVEIFRLFISPLVKFFAQ